MEYLPGYALDEIFITDEGMLTLCDMLSLVPLDTWPDDEEEIMTTRIAGGLPLGCNPKGPRPGTQVPGLNFVQARWPLDARRARRTGRVTSS